MRFVKMEGLGNDFIVTGDAGLLVRGATGDTVRSMCDRRKGIGADGVILVLPSNTADFIFRIFNSDGSEAEMCGNGIRCAAVYAQHEGLSDKSTLVFATCAGRIATERAGTMVRVDMGAPVLDAARIPVAQTDGSVVRRRMTVLDRAFEITAVSMGNPHAVIFADTITDEMVTKYGPALEKDPFFPSRVNVEFVSVLSPSKAVMRVWERGCGETLACGTGACAVAVAGIINNLLGHAVTIGLRGGDLKIEWDAKEGNSVFMTGPARRVFEGNINPF
jgi:diaminopimelate epimerase